MKPAIKPRAKNNQSFLFLQVDVLNQTGKASPNMPIIISVTTSKKSRSSLAFTVNRKFKILLLFIKITTGKVLKKPVEKGCNSGDFKCNEIHHP